MLAVMFPLSSSTSTNAPVVVSSMHEELKKRINAVGSNLEIVNSKLSLLILETRGKMAKMKEP